MKKEHIPGPWEERPYGDKGDIAITQVGEIPHCVVFVMNPMAKARGL